MSSRSYIVRSDEQRYLHTSNFLAASVALATGAPAPERLLTTNENWAVAYLVEAFLGARAATVAGNECSPAALSNTFPLAPQRHSVFIADLGDLRLYLRIALPIIVESIDAQAYAYSYDLDELAIGADEGAAIAEMKALVVDAYFLLKAEQAALGPLQQRHWSFLQRAIGEAP